MYYRRHATPVGELLLLGDEHQLLRLDLPREQAHEPDEMWIVADSAISPVLDDAARQLDEYFQRTRTEFDLPLAPTGTAFQRKVWSTLCAIPYGATISYGELARRIGRPTASRAVGAANGRNPIAIIIPCHRVIGADGTLTGFGGGLAMKQQLLEWERPGLFDPATMA